WHSVIELFGWDVAHFNGEIDRAQMGQRVFADSEMLGKLEAIVHPAVAMQLQSLLRHNQESVVVIEAIKLIEAGLSRWCDAVWVVQCAPEVEIARVLRDRKMAEADARARLAAQGSLEEKIKAASVVIDNNGDEASTRAQVERAWAAIRPETAHDKTGWLADYLTAPAMRTVIAMPSATPAPQPPPIEIQARRARRNDLDALGAVLMQKEKRTEPYPRAELLKLFGERGYRLAVADEKIVALAGWEAENLVATVREIWAESAPAAENGLPKLIALIEAEARALTCETILLLVAADAPAFIRAGAQRLGYQERTLSALHPTWRQVAKERVQPGEQIWVKRLREQLISTPI
ncbi:MAG: dephospho-CoA kinase, partial [Chloroflexi bacterium]|nr:dephospho-CoA kinase [Chloroflexota bacterium]